MIYTVYADQQYQGRKIPLLAVFIIVKKNYSNKVQRSVVTLKDTITTI